MYPLLCSSFFSKLKNSQRGTFLSSCVCVADNRHVSLKSYIRASELIAHPKYRAHAGLRSQQNVYGGNAFGFGRGAVRQAAERLNFEEGLVPPISDERKHRQALPIGCLCHSGYWFVFLTVSRVN